MAWVLAAIAVVGTLLIVKFVRSLSDPFALARAGHAHRLQALVDHDRSLAKAKNPAGETPLHHAAKYGELEAMKVLLSLGADPNAKTPLGATPLHMARAFQEEKAVALLLASGAKDDAGSSVFVNLGDGDIVTALPDDDPEMQRSIALAQSKLPTLRELYAERPKDTAVKIAFETDKGTTEHLWAELLELADDKMRVKVKTPPATHEGDFDPEMDRPVTDIEDWQVEMPDGTIRGGFGFAVIFARAKKDLGALPPGLAEHEHRFVDHAAD